MTNFRGIAESFAHNAFRDLEKLISINAAGQPLFMGGDISGHLNTLRMAKFNIDRAFEAAEKAVA